MSTQAEVQHAHAAEQYRHAARPYQEAAEHQSARWRSHSVPSALPFLTISHCRDHRAASSETRSTIRPEGRFPHSAVASYVDLKTPHTDIGSEHHA